MNPFQRLIVLGTLVFSSLALVSQAAAGVNVQFVEGAPKDRFVITNTLECDLPALAVEIDLQGSRSGLLFDTRRGGAGENVAQPLEIESGSNHIVRLPKISDGARAFRVALSSLPKGAEVRLTVDVDDSIPSGPMGVQRISGSEIMGAIAGLETSDGSLRKSVFDAKGRLTFALDACR